MAGILGSTRFRLWSGVVVAVAMALIPMSQVGRVAAQPAGPTLSANATVFAGGLEFPRGIKFGPDGILYVAEAGLGGKRSTVGLTQSAAGPCKQVVPPVGPYTGGYTARISQVSPTGVRTTVVDDLPSGQTTQAVGGNIQGVADVEFIHGNLYALLSGGGCSHGSADVPNSIIRINPDGTWVVVADLSKYAQTHPTHTIDTSDYEPDGDWYGMVNVNDNLYATEANSSQIVKVNPITIQVSQVADMSAEPWVGPTAMVYHDGNLYVGNLGEFPVTPGTQKIFQVTPDGKVSTYATGLSAVLGVAFDSQGQLYVLETMTAPGLPGPSEAGTGKVVRVTPSGTLQTVATGLSFPTGMTFGPDGQLYVSNFGYGVPGAGQIVKINPNASM